MKKRHLKTIEHQAKFFDKLLTKLELRQRGEYARLLGSRSDEVSRKVMVGDYAKRFVEQNKYWAKCFGIMKAAKPSVKAAVIRAIIQKEGAILRFKSIWDSFSCFEYRYLIATKTGIPAPSHSVENYKRMSANTDQERRRYARFIREDRARNK